MNLLLFLFNYISCKNLSLKMCCFIKQKKEKINLFKWLHQFIIRNNICEWKKPWY